MNKEEIKGHALKYLSKLRKFLKGYKINRFHEVDIETISECTRRCSYCPLSVDKNYKGILMKEEVFYKIIDELAKIKFKGNICLSNYGEPLLDKRLEKLIFYIRTKLRGNINKIFTYSNGDLITLERFRNLRKAGLTYIKFTQHGKEISKNLKEFFENATPEDLKHVKFKNLTTESNLTNRGGSVNVEKRRKKSRFCRGPMNVLTITANGEVALCCNDYYRTVKLGDVSKETIMEIWNKPHYKKIRNELANGIIKAPVCKACVYVRNTNAKSISEHPKVQDNTQGLFDN